MHLALVGEGREDVGLERRDRLAVVGLPVAVGEADRHAAAGEGLGVRPARRCGGCSSLCAAQLVAIGRIALLRAP